jgi:hypothetical protein
MDESKRSLIKRPQRAGGGALGDGCSSDFSRREFLRQTGVVAGVAWSAPVLTSLSSAGAAGTPRPLRCTPSSCPITRGEVLPCRPDDPNFPRCVCASTAQGDTVCIDQTFSCPAPEGACGPGGTCPPGFVCITNTCCDFFGTGSSSICVPSTFVASCASDRPLTGQLHPEARGIFG